MTRTILALCVVVILGASACTPTAPEAPASTSAIPGAVTAAPDPMLETLLTGTARFAPVDLSVDVSALPASEQGALAKLIEAARVFDGLYLRQVWEGNEALFYRLAHDQSPLGRARLQYFLLNKGPWSRLDHNEPFVPGVPARPAQANFYPSTRTKADIEAWQASLDPQRRDVATGFFTTIREGRDGRLEAVPYSTEYRADLAHAARLLREAAALTAQPTLKAFLEKRAEAFFTNDYYASDVAWMEIDASIEPTIGPYETYEDEWFGAKAAFEAFITVRDDAETSKLSRFGAELQSIENNLPIDRKYRNPTLGGLAPIRVVNSLFSSGDGNRGVQTAAFNLPNDERVVAEKGAKRVMLKNVQDAKFRVVLQPIAGVALAPADRGRVTFDAFFTHILMHELMHGLGPQAITVGGARTTVRQQLKETYGTIEEAKADISGLFALQFLVDGGKLDRSLADTMYVTYLASMFRSIRFGITEALGRGVAIQLNYFLDHGGVRTNADGTFAVDPARVQQNVLDLTRDLMTMQATGDYRAARALYDTMGVVRPPVQAVLDKLAGVPVDIAPRFVTAEVLTTPR
jgi:hypothetical protein